MKFFNFRQVIPPIRIHVWGGFGSQLFALVLAWRVSNRFKYRRIQLIFHTSGVTERILELPASWLKDFSVLAVQDFSQAKASTGDSAYSVTLGFLRKLLTLLLMKCGALSRGNSELDFKSLKPWVLEVRGHYTQFLLNDFEVLRLMNLMEISTREPTLNQLSIHYRLGDLLTLSKKTYIHPSRIKNILIELSQQNTPVVFYSDSDQESLSRVLSPFLGDRHAFYSQLSPIDTIKMCVSSKHFLGTNSKLSLWITIFRFQKGRGSAIPYELSHHLKDELNLDCNKPALIIY